MKNINTVNDFSFDFNGVSVPVIWVFARGGFEGLEAVVLGYDLSDMNDGGLSLVLDVEGRKTRSFVGIDEDGTLYSDIMKPAHYGEAVPFRYNG